VVKTCTEIGRHVQPLGIEHEVARSPLLSRDGWSDIDLPQRPAFPHAPDLDSALLGCATAAAET